MWVKRNGAGINFPRLFLNTRINKSISITETGNPSNGGILFRLTKASANTDKTVGAGALNNTWKLVTLTWNGSLMRAYINGVEDGSPVSFTGPIDSVVSGQLPVIGGETGAHEGNNNPSWFNGSIDEVRVYNRALSATEVQQLYNLGR
jgi:hypothetical protein